MSLFKLIITVTTFLKVEQILHNKITIVRLTKKYKTQLYIAHRDHLKFKDRENKA